MRILVGLSGGADSALTAKRLLEAGHTVAGAFLRLFDESDASGAEYVARVLGIPLFVVDGRKAFEQSVIADFCAEYARGRTPNPCALCNREIKTRLLCAQASEHGYERVATGHFARIGCENGRFFIASALDQTRDQSYFLWRLSPDTIATLLFPLSEERKALQAAEAALLTAPGTRESREVCFIPDDDHLRFLARVLPEHAKKPGDFTDLTGRVIGHHEGIYRYTIGQRRGLGTGFGTRLYVTHIDPETGRITLGGREACLSRVCTLEELNFQKLAPQTEGAVACFARLRYRARLLPAEITFLGNRARLSFSDGGAAIASPGQSAVCYDASGAVLCGGILCSEQDEV